MHIHAADALIISPNMGFSEVKGSIRLFAEFTFHALLQI